MTTLHDDRGDHSFVVLAPCLPIDDDDADSAEAERYASTVSAIVRERQGAWIGLAEHDKTGSRTAADATVIPVMLTADEEQRFQTVTRNHLWPVHHGVAALQRFEASAADVFRAVNERFARLAVETAAPGATIWVHDFHLALVPEMIRICRDDVRIGYFHHVPFPALELFAQLPWRANLLSGMAAADVIGFQLDWDVRNFRAALRYFTDIDPDNTGTVINAYPESTDAGAIRALAEAPRILAGADRLRHDCGAPTTLIASVDRLDVTAGIRHRLHAYEELLEAGTIDPQTTALVLFAVPSTNGSAADPTLRDDVDQLVERINGRFGSLGAPAIHHHCRPWSLETAVALYLATDILVVSSLREGMSLAAKEYVAARRHRGGALVLSEFAGAAQELDRSIMVNPHDGEALKDAITRALSLPEAETRARMASMGEFVEHRDAWHWAQSFLADLEGGPPGRAVCSTRPDFVMTDSRVST